MNDQNNEWKCPICGYNAKNDEERNMHIKSSFDKAHQELLKEKTKKKVTQTKEGAEEMWEDVKGNVKKVFND